MSIFIVGDVHGNYKSLTSSLEKSGCDVNADTIILVGDVVDRGKENAKVVNFIAEHKGNIHLICGNHEYQHRQLLKYYRALAKAPAIRKMAAGIIRHYTPEGKIFRDKSEIERLRCDEKERRKEIEKHPKTFEEWQKQFLIYTLAWEDDSLWQIVLYLLRCADIPMMPSIPFTSTFQAPIKRERTLSRYSRARHRNSISNRVLACIGMNR